MTLTNQNIINAGSSFPVGVFKIGAPGQIKQLQAVVPVDENGDPYPTGLNLGAYDFVSVGYPAADTEVYTFKTGGSGGTTIATVTLVYTSSAKTFLSTVTKT